jgi:1-acyl-sn-glycerol-3-phosphate acyltransferase
VAPSRSDQQLNELLERAVERPPGLTQDVVRVVARNAARLWRTRFEGLDEVPRDGGALIASNHGSYLDHFFLACRIDRPVNFMAASELFANPLVARLLSALGAFPVRRGAHDHAAMEAAEAIVGRGGIVVIYPQGGIRPSLETQPRHGIGIVALATGAPVVPAAIVDATALHKAGFLRFRRLSVRFARPLAQGPEHPVSEHDAERLTGEVWRRVVELFGQGAGERP